MHKHATILQRIATITLQFALPAVLLLSPLYLLVSPAFVRHEYRLSHIPASARLAPTERLAISDVLIGYLRGWNSEEEMTSLTTSTGELALTDREISHMVDVKRVLGWFLAAQRLALGLSVLAGVYLLYEAGAAQLGRQLRLAAVTAAAIIGALVAMSLVDFELFFTAFHQVLFEEGTWTFWETDTLIQLYPLAFWADAMWKLGAVILVGLGMAYAAGTILSRSCARASRERP
jgi:integral membrane protein (TIGR01906 family)